MAGLLAGSLRARRRPLPEPAVAGSRRRAGVPAMLLAAPAPWPRAVVPGPPPAGPARSCRPPRYARVDDPAYGLAGPGGRHGDTDLSGLRRRREPRRPDLLHLRHQPAPARTGGGGGTAHGDAGIPAPRGRRTRED